MWDDMKKVPNQLVGAPLGTDVQIECHVEASPRSINYWIKDTGMCACIIDHCEWKIIDRHLLQVK